MAAQDLSQEATALAVHHLRGFLRRLEADGLAPGGVHAHARAFNLQLGNLVFGRGLLRVHGKGNKEWACSDDGVYLGCLVTPLDHFAEIRFGQQVHFTLDHVLEGHRGLR